MGWKFKKGRYRCFFQEMNDTNLLKYTYSLHGKNITRSELRKKDESLYQALWERKLLDKVKQEPGRRPRGFLSGMNNQELVEYAYSLYGKKVSRSELSKDSRLYQFLIQRGLISKFRTNENIRRSGFFTNMDDDELLKYTHKLYGKNVTRGKLKKKDSSLYLTLRNRQLLMSINLERMLKGYYKDFNQVKADLWKWIEEHEGEFPTANRLKETGRGGLARGIEKYHGSIYIIREKIGYNEIKRIELARELEEIVKTL